MSVNIRVHWALFIKVNYTEHWDINSSLAKKTQIHGKLSEKNAATGETLGMTLCY